MAGKQNAGDSDPAPDPAGGRFAQKKLSPAPEKPPIWLSPAFSPASKTPAGGPRRGFSLRLGPVRYFPPARAGDSPALVLHDRTRAAGELELALVDAGQSVGEGRAMVEVRISSNAVQAAAWIHDINKRQIPFATATALNDLAFMVRKRGLYDLQTAMKIRNPGLRKKALAVIKAGKKQKPHPFAVVGIPEKVGFLNLHATGKRKKAKGQFLAVPTKLAQSQKTPRGKTKKANQPITFRNGGAKPGAKATKRKRKATKGIDKSGRRLHVLGGRSVGGKLAKRGVSTWYFLVRSARIRKSWPLERMAQQVMGQHFPRAYRRAFAKAVRSKR